jgi:hypothetical protein
MKKSILISLTLLIVALLIVTGCQKAVELGEVMEEKADSVVAPDSSEEGEISDGLNEMEDFDTLEGDLEDEDLGLEGLEDLDFE